MTVCVYHKQSKTLAVDSQLTYGDRRRYGKKFARLPDGGWAIFAGDVASGRKALRALSRGQALPVQAMANIDLITMDAKGNATFYNGCDVGEPVKRSDAWGSGAEIAIGALEMGATAEQAAKVACKHSSTCGGKVHVLTLGE